MHGRTADGEDRLLRRIVAVLVSLAVLAERAAGRSWPVRFIVLWLLRRAETAACAFVLEETGMPVVFEDFAPIGNGPDDALRLAWRLRAFAAALSELLPDPCGFDHRPARPARPGLSFGHAALAFVRALAGWTPRPIDTS